MPSASKYVMQRFTIAIRNGADTVDAIREATGYADNGAREVIRHLEKNSYATRSYGHATVNGKCKKIMTVSLTPSGLLLANDAPIKVSRSGKRTPTHKDPSILDRDHTVYNKWLRRLKAKALGIQL